MESIAHNPAEDLMEFDIIYLPQECSTPSFVPTKVDQCLPPDQNMYTYDLENPNLSMYGSLYNTLNDPHSIQNAETVIGMCQ